VALLLLGKQHRGAHVPFARFRRELEVAVPTFVRGFYRRFGAPRTSLVEPSEEVFDRPATVYNAL